MIAIGCCRLCIHHLSRESIQLVDTEPAGKSVICAAQGIVYRAWIANIHIYKCAFGITGALQNDGREDLSIYVAPFLWLCWRSNSDVAPVDGTSDTAECLMASKASKAIPHLLHFLCVWKMNYFVDDGHQTNCEGHK